MTKPSSSSPEPTIESERLSIRSLCSADEELYCGLYMDAEVMRFVGEPLPRARAAGGLRKTLELMSRTPFQRRVVVLIDRASQQPIGISSIHIVDAKRGCAEVGMLLKPTSHARGLARECSVALLTQAFTRPQVNELIAHSAVGNDVIERLLTDLGFIRGAAVPASKDRPPRTRWSVGREAWSKRSKVDCE